MEFPVAAEQKLLRQTVHEFVAKEGRASRSRRRERARRFGKTK